MQGRKKALSTRHLFESYLRLSILLPAGVRISSFLHPETVERALQPEKYFMLFWSLGWRHIIKKGEEFQAHDDF